MVVEEKSSYLVEVEEARAASSDRPSSSPVYRCIFAKDGLLTPSSTSDDDDQVHSPWDFFTGSVKRCPQNRMLLGRRELNNIDGKVGEYVWQTYEEVYQKALKIGSALMSRPGGINMGGDRCGIYGSNCPEWIIVMHACNSQGIPYVPLYDTLGANAVEFIINHAEVSAAFVQENKIDCILKCLPRCNAHLKTIVSFGTLTDDKKEYAAQLGVSCFSWEEFLLSANTNYRLPSRNKDSICTIMYTSGTTGDPKGVVLTNKAVTTQVINTERLLLETDIVVTEEDSYFSFLPLAHIFDQIFESYCIFKGASIGYWSGDAQHLIADIQELKPTLFCGVPRVYERIYAVMRQKISSGGPFSKKLFQFAYEHKLRNLQRGVRQDKAAPFYDKIVFQNIKDILGGKIRMMLSGAAPIPKHVEEFLRVTSCSVFIQGYGLTESCAGCFTSIANVYSMIGTVGVPSTTIEARLESVPDMEYDALDPAVPRGEICLRGNTLFSGYYKRPDLTSEVIIDGWFHTGDIGELQPNGTMKIIDRKKNIFKLSQGEYIAVENIESSYMQCPLITMIWVYGNSFESFLVCVAVPTRKALEEWAAANNITESFELLCKHPNARKYILDELNDTARRLELRGFEMLKAIHLEPVPFDMERDLITPTFKLKRPQLIKCYKDRIDELYQDVAAMKQTVQL